MWDGLQDTLITRHKGKVHKVTSASFKDDNQIEMH